MPMHSFDVVILGAGAAGLSAADALVRAGKRVAVLEARDRLGGRIATVHPAFSPAPVELGAEFVHGRPAAIFDLAARGSPPLSIHELTWRPTRSQAGRLESSRGDDDSERSCERLHRQIEPRRRESYAEFLRRAQGDESAKAAAREYVEGFHAADPERISAAAVRAADDAEAACEGDRTFRVTDGYDALVRRLAVALDPEDVFLNTVAHEVTWGGDPLGTSSPAAPVVIRARSRGGGFALPEFTAARVLVTLPVGVLQARPDEDEGALRFRPELPLTKRRAIGALAVGEVARVTFELRQEFWRELSRRHGTAGENLEFVQSEDPVFPVWWTAHPVSAGLLTAWAGGPRAQRLLSASAGTDDGGALVRREALRACTRAFGVEAALVERALVGWHFHDWSRDPFSRGAYSYLTVGHEDAAHRLAAPLAGRLFFAGEATHWEGENGTVHGAVSSGQRAAREILARPVR